jgi:RNase H-fold protein (predicted Holliday junction resolvase)
MRVVGLDVGEKRIGIAISDSTRHAGEAASRVATCGLDSMRLDCRAREIARSRQKKTASARSWSGCRVA